MQHLRRTEIPLGRRRCERLVQGLEACSRQHADRRLVLELARVHALLGVHLTPHERGAGDAARTDKTGASAGILKLANWPDSEATELGLGAERELAQQLLAELTQALLNAEAPAADLATVTALVEPLQAPAGRFTPVILRHGSDRFAVTGVALLLTPRDGSLVEPALLAAALSRALSEGLGVTEATQVPGM